MARKFVALRREAASATIPGYERLAVQTIRRVVRLQERRRKLRRELKLVDEELRLARGQVRTLMQPRADVPAGELAQDPQMRTVEIYAGDRLVRTIDGDNKVS